MSSVGCSVRNVLIGKLVSNAPLPPFPTAKVPVNAAKKAISSTQSPKDVSRAVRIAQDVAQLTCVIAACRLRYLMGVVGVLGVAKGTILTCSVIDA